MTIRPAIAGDREVVASIYESAFPNEERDLVTEVAVSLLVNGSSEGVVSLLAEADGNPVGHIAFSPVTNADSDEQIGFILAPLAVKREYQKRGIGSALIKHGLQSLDEGGGHVVFVYGDPVYYGRFGFDGESAKAFTTPFPLQYPHGWLSPWGRYQIHPLPSLSRVSKH